MKKFTLVFLRLLLILACVFSGIHVFAQEEDTEEIVVFVTIQQIGGFEMPAVLRNNVLYLPVADLFNALKIKTIVSADGDSVSGFFLNTETNYCFDNQNKNIILKNKVIDLAPEDILLNNQSLYLSIKYLDLFGLPAKFNFRALSVNISPVVELPLIRELRLESMRKNLNRLNGEIIADTTIPRKYPLFHFGMADYSVISTQQVNGPCDNRINAVLGGTLFGGETQIGLNYSTDQPFTEEEQQYFWRYANNDLKIIRQIIAGKIVSQATSSIYSPVVGLQLSNTPTTYRRSFGSYTLSDFTQPGWIVELYVNNVLVDYQRADASGFYTFRVPMVYGNTNVKLRFYGPWGEEKSRERNLVVPYNFIPEGELEYTVSGGVVEDKVLSRYSRGNINYGLTRWMTIGAGMEYLSSVTSGPFMPFMNMSMRIGSSMLVSGDYTHGVRFKGLANYRLPTDVQFDAMYIRYAKGQTAINYNILEEKKFAVSMPVRGKKISSFARLSIDQLTLPQTSSTTAEALLSGSYFGINTNFTTYLLMGEHTTPYLYSNLSLGFLFRKDLMFTPQIQFDYVRGEIISGKLELEKRIFKKGYLTVSFERNQRSNFNNIQAGLRYDFSGLQTAFTFMQTNYHSNFIESVRGSLIADARSKTAVLHSRTSTGRGGIVIIPFLDINDNGKRDRDEPKLSGLNIRINGGWIQEDRKDTVLRVYELEPYSYYFLTADQNSISNIAWRLTKSSFKIYVDPNQMKLLEIPVGVFGEVSGTVYLQNQSKKGQGRIIVNIYSPDGKKMGSVLSESDGYFSYMGLPPGDYYACPDSAQMNKLNMTSEPARRSFTIRQIPEGDVADDLEFVLGIK